MAELLSSSEDESLGDEPEERVAPPPSRSDRAPFREASAAAVAVSNTPEEPEEELLESLFSPEKREPIQKKPRYSDELFPLTPSPTSAKSSQSNNTDDGAVARRLEGGKPVVSARAMLMQFLPKTTPMKPSAPPKPLPIERTLALDDTTDGVGGEGSAWRKKPKQMSESERIARKYGLLPSKETERQVAGNAANPSATMEKDPRRRHSTPSPARASERPTQRPSPLSKREAFWKSQAMSDEDEQETKTASGATYVSPFSARNKQQQQNGFRDVRRRREVPKVDKETFYTDDAQQPAPVNRPRHVIASRLTAAEGDGKDDDGWFSDAKEINSEEDDNQELLTTPEDSKKPMVSTIDRSRSRAIGPSRKRGRPTASSSKRHRGSDEDDGSDSELVELNRWPMLPPPKHGDLGSLTLQSPLDQGTSLEICANINNYLFDYQREGAQFLYNAYAKHAGAILGDEMGLGKTIQVIALLSAILQKQGDDRDKQVWKQVRKDRRERNEDGSVKGLSGSNHANPILIVVPASLLHNWESELRVWMCVQTIILIGKPEEREQIIEQAGKGDYEIVICSYDVLKITLDKLKRVPWEVIVFDEMHCLKNPESQLTQAVKAIKCPRKLGLTGTLMQNNEKELHCLIDTIAPGVLGSWQEFRSFYGDDIEYGRKKSAVPEAVERSRKKEKKLRQVLVPYYLRREKEINPCFQEIKKSDQVVFCDLTPYQLAAYKRILEMPEFELLRQGEELCDCGRESGRKRKECCYLTPQSLGTGRRALLWERFHPEGEACKSCPNCMGLVCMAQLLKLSNHMELLKVNPRDPPYLQKYQADFAATAFGKDVDAVGGVQQVSSFQDMRAIGTQTCGKMLVLEKLLALWKRKRQKTLLFSRSTRMLDILQLFLISKAVTYLRLDGQTKVDERLQLVNQFNDPASTTSVFLISTRAGGLGLNLPTATNVVIFDPSWNPAHDCQAQDRAYRIGQTKDVQVYRLITLGTIEEMIYVRQIYKQQLSDTTLKGVKAPRYFEGVQGDRRQQGELFGIRNLLCWKEGGVLKDIQDAYQRDRDDIMVQQNQVQYSGRDATPQSGKKSRSRSKRNMDDMDEEMVEVADEMTSGLLTTTAATEENQTSPQGKAKPSGESMTTGREDHESDNDGDVHDTESVLLQGARTFMHEKIVCEDEGSESDALAAVFSETDEEEDHGEAAATETATATNVDQHPLPVQIPHASAPTPPAKSPSAVVASPATATGATPKKSPKGTAWKPSGENADETTPRKTLYIPKYL